MLTVDLNSFWRRDPSSKWHGKDWCNAKISLMQSRKNGNDASAIVMEYACWSVVRGGS